MKKLKFILLLFVTVSRVTICSAQGESSLVHWISIREALENVKVQPKPILIDFYTDWCGWCKTMMKTTYSDPGLADYINTYFYAVKFDAEGKDTVDYLGKKYIPLNNLPRTTHPFAEEMLKGKMMYPSTIFLSGYDKTNNSFLMNLTAQGYLDIKKIQPMLVYSLENVFRNAQPDEFSKLFEFTFNDSIPLKREGTIEWLNPEDGFERDTTGKKKLIYISTTWCNSCKVMKQAVFTDLQIEKNILKYFTPIDFDPSFDKPVIFEGKNYINTKEEGTPFHQLAITLMNNNFTIPSLIILDEKNQVIDNIPFFLPPTLFNDILNFYGGNVYKSKSWSDYQLTVKH